MEKHKIFKEITNVLIVNMCAPDDLRSESIITYLKVKFLKIGVESTTADFFQSESVGSSLPLRKHPLKLEFLKAHSESVTTGSSSRKYGMPL